MSCALRRCHSWAVFDTKDEDEDEEEDDEEHATRKADAVRHRTNERRYHVLLRAAMANFREEVRRQVQPSAAKLSHDQHHNINRPVQQHTTIEDEEAFLLMSARAMGRMQHELQRQTKLCELARLATEAERLKVARLQLELDYLTRSSTSARARQALALRRDRTRVQNTSRTPADTQNETNEVRAN